MARHLGRDMRGLAPDRLAGQMPRVPAGVLHFVEGAFDPFPQADSPLEPSGWGRTLVGGGGQGCPGPGSPGSPVANRS